MSRERAGRRGADHRAFRPTLDGRLDPRLLLSAGGHHHLAPLGPRIHTQVAANGLIVVVTTPDRAKFNVIVANGGTVRALPLPGGRVDIIAEGTNSATDLVISPRSKLRDAQGTAHIFSPELGRQGATLQVGKIEVPSGQIHSILGYHTADLSGPIVIGGTATVDRIAFNSLQPGASIQTGGDLNTLDVANNINLTGGPGIQVGRDLNSLTVGGNFTLNGGARLLVQRDLGLVLQPAKGTAPAPVAAPPSGAQAAAVVSGNLTVGPGSELVITRAAVAPFLVRGNISGRSRINIPSISVPSASFLFVALGTVTP